MDKVFFYIVVAVDGQKCFINKDMDYSDYFEDVLRFESYDLAADFIEKHSLTGRAEILKYTP